MYINPFWCGVLVTIVAEIIAVFAFAFVEAFKRGNKHD